MDLTNLTPEQVENLKALLEKSAQIHAEKAVDDLLKYLSAVPSVGGILSAAAQGAISHIGLGSVVQEASRVIFDAIAEWIREASGKDYGIGLKSESVTWEDNR